MPLSNNVKGALFMTLSMAGFIGNDALVKAVGHQMNVGQIMFVRGLMTTVFVYAIARSMGALRPLRVLFQPAVAARIVFEVLAAVTYLAALPHMQLANIASILQALPLAVTLGAALFLAEPTGWRRWLAILAGFGGVLLIVRPSADGFNVWSLLAVSCVFLAAGRDLCTKKIDSAVPSLMVTTLTAMGTSLTGALMIGPLGGWQPMDLSMFLHLAGAAVLVFFGYQFIIIAMRIGEISFIAPFRYTGLLVAIVLGMIFFGETLDGPMVAGILVVVGSGLYTFHRENRLRSAGHG